VQSSNLGPCTRDSLAAPRQGDVPASYFAHQPGPLIPRRARPFQGRRCAKQISALQSAVDLCCEITDDSVDETLLSSLLCYLKSNIVTDSLSISDNQRTAAGISTYLTFIRVPLCLLTSPLELAAISSITTS
jgi:hypothetical protein